MPMEIFTKGNGKTIKLMDQGFIHMLMEQSMKEIGLKINSMVMVQKPGLMELNIKVITN